MCIRDRNEPVKSYAPGSPERAALKERLRSMSSERIDIPLIIGGKEVHTGELAESVMPHNHRHVLAQWHRASAASIDQAVAAAKEAAKDWANWAWECLLYTSDAADDLLCVDLGGRRIIKKKTK